MRKSIASLAGLCLVVVSAASIPLAQAEPSPEPTPATDNSTHSSFIIKLKDQSGKQLQSTIDQAAQDSGVELRQTQTLSTGALVVDSPQQLDANQEKTVLDTLTNRDDIAYAVPNLWLTTSSVPNDTDYSKQWSYQHPVAGVNMWRAWEMAQGKNQIISVIDTGIVKHPDLDSKVLPGYDMITSVEAARDHDGRDANPQDEGDWHQNKECGPDQPSSWHGSHVAGIAAAVSNNNQGIAGAAPEAKILPVRVIGKCGGSLSDIIDGLVWAAGGTVQDIPVNTNIPTVINMSLGGLGSCSIPFQEAIDAAVGRGIPVVVAAGNEREDVSKHVPANCKNVIVVGAEDMHGNRAHYSNYGANVDLLAPGGSGQPRMSNEDIWSTIDRGEQGPRGASYGPMPGTSMAAPLVAGTVALLRSVNPDLTPAQLRETLRNTARPMPGICRGSTVDQCGAGILDAAAAVAKVSGVDLAAGSNGMTNGSFEDGAEGWKASSDSIITKTEAHDGSMAVKFLGTGKETTQKLTRTIEVPRGDGMAILSYWVKITSTETSMRVVTDKLDVTVGNQSHLITNLDKGTRFVPVYVDLSAHKGQQITLTMEADESRDSKTTITVDDFTLKLVAMGA